MAMERSATPEKSSLDWMEMASGNPMPFASSLLIGGKSVDAQGDKVFTRANPLSAQIVTIAAAASLADAEDAALAAAAAFPDWSTSPCAMRQTILEQAAKLLIEATEIFTRTMMAETGATRDWCRFNIDYGAKIFQDAAAMAVHVPGSICPDDLITGTSFSLRQPAGVCLAISPWNAPILLAIRSIALALACGNCVILKSSELAPATQRLLGDLLQQAGLPDGVLNIISNAPADAAAIVETLIAHPVVRRVNFTGSTRVGKIVAQIGARHLKRCLLELGGKAPLIVLDDADLEQATRAAAFGAFFNQGQICMSTERIILVDAIADEFLSLFVSKAKTVKAGDPALGLTPLGSLISIESGRRITGMIDDAVTRGAHVLTGGRVHDTLMDATVVDHVLPGMRLYREESFGPVVSIIRVADADEAVTIANDCEYGLSGAVFSRDLHRALDVARRVETGILHINSATVADDPFMPFGGVKASGYGRFGGVAALDEFTELRWVSLASGPAKYPI
ncbi:aldehyde dehydrogenase family protein [Agrobacterium vitis]|uniref:Aldehyde dehydrogenase n=1 Tax=Agrobacterium vitis TaxID=373 RepID=A0A368P1V6_AGRVI|nr:aldehyde dehydrogenase [Agrobacterium vitis]KAA3510818.1 aldehyde dehydrogenase [Agrobacterium vitis]KAA3528099.1 aldehyde dehydrogenase [Agrobacterium vitis]MCF1478555.1 aldehyde dehydrogenase [Agrobacterium vitis]MUZ96716.1 aldehyde dehydrogenase family protein [Agrobacterium vitis]MVA28431.1 aldehyde dehydrogenase family protein [Agrobacterium vitis]